EMIVMSVGYLLVTCPAFAKVMALDDAGVLEQLDGAVDGGDRDAVVDSGAAPIKLFDVRVIGGTREHARDDATLLRHPHALGGAQRLDVCSRVGHAAFRRCSRHHNGAGARAKSAARAP